MEENHCHGSRGFVYVAFGDLFIHEASESAIRTREINNLPCTLITDAMPEEQSIEQSFDNIIVQDFRHSFLDKLRMRFSPYEQTIFLDTDTFVVEPLHDVFALLERFDLAIQFTEGGHHYSTPEIPSSFDEPSAGIIAWRRSAVVDVFFDRWEHEYAAIEEAQGCDGAWDQRSLKSAVWHSDIRIAPLSNCWQFCTYKPNVLAGPVRLVHGRNLTKKIIQGINASQELRMWHPQVGACPAYSYATLLEMLRFLLAYAGLFAKQIIRRGLHATGIAPFPEQKRLA